MQKDAQITKNNVLGPQLEVFCYDPNTEHCRDKYCCTDASDHGKHVICTEMTVSFLDFTKNRSNDLATPSLEFGFLDLKPSSQWRLCTMRWIEAWEENVAPPVILEPCEETALKIVPFDILNNIQLNR